MREGRASSPTRARLEVVGATVCIRRFSKIVGRGLTKLHSREKKLLTFHEFSTSVGAIDGLILSYVVRSRADGKGRFSRTGKAAGSALSSGTRRHVTDDVGREHDDGGSPLRLRSAYAFLLAGTARWLRRVSAPRCRTARLLHVPRARGALPPSGARKNARHFADERASYRGHPSACGVRKPPTGAEGAATDA